MRIPIALLSLIVASALRAQVQVIDHPAFSSRSSTVLEVSRVILSDTATVLRFHVADAPCEMFSISADCFLRDSRGSVYLLRTAEGITPDCALQLPASGEADFSLIFPPLRKDSLSYIDFTEGEDVEGAYAIRGICLHVQEELVETAAPDSGESALRVHHAGIVSLDSLFCSILHRFSGKVLLVDFWTTWCGPCRMAHRLLLPLKEELRGKGIVYLYVTGETSPVEKWKEMIPHIGGDHYRLDSGQWWFLCRQQGVEGVPTYFVVDKRGIIRYRQTGFPGTERLKTELLKCLEEKGR